MKTLFATPFYAKPCLCTPRIGDVCSAQVSNYLEGFASKMLRPALKVKAMDEAMGPAGVSSDPILEHDVEKRAKLIQRMVRIGMGRSTLQCKCVIGIFSLKRKATKYDEYLTVEK